jgi:hypothetical protein
MLTSSAKAREAEDNTSARGRLVQRRGSTAALAAAHAGDSPHAPGPSEGAAASSSLSGASDELLVETPPGAPGEVLSL